MKILVVLMILFTQSCASIIQGTIENKSMVYFSSSPNNALVRVNGVKICQTPCQYRINTGDFKYISFEKIGFLPIEIDAKDSDINAALAGNLIFGGGVGLGLDLLTGRALVNKDSINVVFKK